MPVYAYTVMDFAERSLRGSLTADTAAEGRQRLRDQGLRVLEFGQAGVARSIFGLRLHSRRRRQEQVAEVARYLSLLLRSAVPVVEALDVLTRRRDGRLTDVLKDVRDRVTGGAPLADALTVHARWFDPIFVSAVRVGEVTGHLDDALSELAEHLESGQRLRGQLTSALTYPVILTCIGVAVVIFLMSYVIPQLLTVLAASDRPLPASTMLLKGMSDLLIDHWPLAVTAVLGLLVIGSLVLRSESGRRSWQRLQLRLPLLGPLIQKNTVAQFAQRMSLLLGTGVPFLDAVITVKALTRNLVLADELSTMAQSVESGGRIAATIADSRIFPPVVAHLVSVGQDTGELPAMLAQLKDSYQTEVRLAITRFTAALEPLLIVVLATMVGFVVFACLMPILEATRGIVE